MKLENSFEVPASPEAAWDLLLDVPRVVPCMPGAELTETVDETHWKAKMNVKLGPISLTFLTDVARDEADEATRTVKLSATGREARGRGQARATVESRLEAAGEGTRVSIATDLSLSGPAAQYGRGLVADVSEQLVGRFADCLRSARVVDGRGGECRRHCAGRAPTRETGWWPAARAGRAVGPGQAPLPAALSAAS